jgi:hypothetical protein
VSEERPEAATQQVVEDESRPLDQSAPPTRARASSPLRIECPSCGSHRVFHSRPRFARDHVVKRLFPVAFYRCHSCNWRKARFKGGAKALLLYVISLIGYLGAIALLVAVIVGLFMLLVDLVGTSRGTSVGWQAAPRAARRESALQCRSPSFGMIRSRALYGVPSDRAESMSIAVAPTVSCGAASCCSAHPNPLT